MSCSGKVETFSTTMRKPQCFYNDFTELAAKLSVGLTSAALLLGFNLRKHLHSTICKRPVETDPTGDSTQGRGRQRQRPGSFDRQNDRIAEGRATNEGDLPLADTTVLQISRSGCNRAFWDVRAVEITSPACLNDPGGAEGRSQTAGWLLRLFDLSAPAERAGSTAPTEPSAVLEFAAHLPSVAAAPAQRVAVTYKEEETGPPRPHPARAHVLCSFV